MASVNKAILVGNLGRDPDIRLTSAGQTVANFSIATNERWTAQNGERVERTEWHRVVAWGRLAEICAEYLCRGRQIYVEGRLQTREWEDRDGILRYTTEVVAQDIQFLGRPGGHQQASDEPTPGPESEPEPQPESELESDPGDAGLVEVTMSGDDAASEAVPS
jgi:single-strand DNA-binding protein